MNKIAHVYAITCTATGQSYVGCSQALKQRWYAHRLMLRNGTHQSPALQQAWDIYGPTAFLLEILETLFSSSKAERLIAEAKWVKKKGSYNAMPSNQEGTGFTLAPNARQNVGEHTKRRWADPEERAKLAQGLINRWSNPEARKLQSAKLAEINSNPERRSQQATAMQEAWKDPEKGERLRRRLESRWADPEAKQRQSDKLRASWAKRKANKIT